MITFPDRIKKIIELSGSAEKLANISGMSSRVIGQYLAGKSDPTRLKLIALANAALVNIEWLATGKGPMREEDRETFHMPLLALIIEALEEYEMDAGKKLTPAEKADFISEAYNKCIDDEEASSQTKDNILKSMKVFSDFFNSVDSMIKTKKGRERVRKTLTRKFRISLSKDETEWEVGEFIGSRILKAHFEKGTLKFPMKDKDGTIRLIDFKDLEVEKDTKNQKP